MSESKTEVILYGKKGCCLCDKAKQIIQKVQQQYPLTLLEVDITGDPKLMEKYQFLIPVIAVNGQDTFISEVSESDFRSFLAGQ
jgi:thiol-disulfide isomerase/thioredoxin